MELRGQFSNPLTRKHLDVLVEAVERGWRSDEVAEQALREPIRPHIRDMVDVDELVKRYLRGRMIRRLAVENTISESTVKRLLRARGVHRSQ